METKEETSFTESIIYGDRASDRTENSNSFYFFQVGLIDEKNRG